MTTIYYAVLIEYNNSNIEIILLETKDYKEALEKYKLEKNTILEINKTPEVIKANNIKIYLDKIINDQIKPTKVKRMFKTLFIRKNNKSKFKKIPL